MVSVNHVKSVLSVKERQKPESAAVNINDLPHIPVFPEFIPISQLNVSKAMLIIVIKSGKIQIFVFQKIIIGISTASMTVTYDYITGVFI